MITKNKYTQRLYEEWKKHGKLVIAADHDSTIFPYKGEFDIDNKEDIDRCVELLKQCQATGCYLVIHTACREDRYDDIIRYCEQIGLKVDSINKTPIDIPFGKTGSKPYANIFIDDRSGMIEAMDILESALYQYRGYLKSQQKDTGE